MSHKIFKIILGLAIVALPLYVLRFNIGPMPTTVLEVLIYLAFVLFLVTGSFKNIKTSFPIYIGAVFVLTGLIGALRDPNLISGLGIWKAYFFDGYLVLLMVLSLRKEDIDGYLSFLIASGLLAALGSFVLFSQGIESSDGRLLDLDRLSPNYLAMFLAPILIIAATKTLANLRKKSPWIVYLISTLILGYALFLTGSRGGYTAALSGLVAVLLSLFITGRNARLAKNLLLIVLVAILAGTYLVFKPDWTSHDRKATSSNVRYYIWVTSVEMIGREPVFGVGLSNYQNYFSQLTEDRVNYPEFISPQALTAHNLYLQIYLTCGLLGLIAFLILVVKTRFWRLDDIALSASMISILIFGLFDTPFYKNDLAIIFWLIISFLYLTQASGRKNA